jgi:hypothetical protein
VSDGLFKFERDFQTDLRCIPMVVRHRLDQCGIKMSLKEWVKLGPEQRSEVLGRIDEPVERFAEAVDALVERRMGQRPARLPIEADPAWADTTRVPLTQPQWAGLAPLQRFALYKLSRSSHKNENFVPACREFGVP